MLVLSIHDEVMVSMGERVRVRVGDRVVLQGSLYGRSHERGEVVRVDDRTGEIEVRVGMGLPLQFHSSDVRVLDAVESLAELDSPKRPPG